MAARCRTFGDYVMTSVSTGRGGKVAESSERYKETGKPDEKAFLNAFKLDSDADANAQTFTEDETLTPDQNSQTASKVTPTTHDLSEQDTSATLDGLVPDLERQPPPTYDIGPIPSKGSGLLSAAAIMAGTNSQSGFTEGLQLEARTLMAQVDRVLTNMFEKGAKGEANTDKLDKLSVRLGNSIHQLIISLELDMDVATADEPAFVLTHPEDVSALIASTLNDISINMSQISYEFHTVVQDLFRPTPTPSARTAAVNYLAMKGLDANLSTLETALAKILEMQR